jgi:hypothetical protein
MIFDDRTMFSWYWKFVHNSLLSLKLLSDRVSYYTVMNIYIRDFFIVSEYSVRFLYWWVKMIDCLSTDLFTTSILKVYIFIRVIQCSLIIEMRTILIYSYCMWNVLFIRSIKWFRKKSFQKQARTMTNNARNRTNTIIISSFESIELLIIISIWERFIASQLHHYETISMSFINQFNHALNEKIFDSITNRAIYRDKICIVEL